MWVICFALTVTTSVKQIRNEGCSQSDRDVIYCLISVSSSSSGSTMLHWPLLASLISIWVIDDLAKFCLYKGVWCFQLSRATLTSSSDVNLQEESFLDALPTDERLKKVRIIIVNVPCSKSGIVNPVDFVLQEGVTSSLKELARGNADSSKVKGLAFQHLSFLRHAMKFPQVQAIIYITRSTHNSENMDVVKKAMEMNQEERSKQTSFYELTPALPRLAQSLREAARISNGLQNEISLMHKGKWVINF